MPELPEVETVRRGLEELIIGKHVAKTSFTYQKQFPNAASDVQQFLIGSTIHTVGRRGKVLIIELNTGYSLVVHLKMTGQLVFVPERGDQWGAGHPTDSLVGRLPDKSTHVTLHFRDGSTLYYNDQRRFGWVKLLPSHDIHAIKLLKTMGPEPLSKDFTTEVFAANMQRRKGAVVKAALLDQTVVAGVGNIYADESLWAAKIHPERRVHTLADEELICLHKEIIAILKVAIKAGGSTNKNYVNARGQKGSYMHFAKVFRREGQPCPRCGTKIGKSKVAGRGTHICTTCQLQFT